MIIPIPTPGILVLPAELMNNVGIKFEQCVDKSPCFVFSLAT